MATYQGTPASMAKNPRSITLAQVGRSRVLKTTTLGRVAIRTTLRSPIFAFAMLHVSSLGSATTGTNRAGCPLSSFAIAFQKVSGSYVLFRIGLNASQASVVGSYVSFDYLLFQR